MNKIETNTKDIYHISDHNNLVYISFQIISQTKGLKVIDSKHYAAFKAPGFLGMKRVYTVQRGMS